MIIYTIHKWYSSFSKCKNKIKILVLFLITAQYNDHKQKE